MTGVALAYVFTTDYKSLSCRPGPIRGNCRRRIAVRWFSIIRLDLDLSQPRAHDLSRLGVCHDSTDCHTSEMLRHMKRSSLVSETNCRPSLPSTMDAYQPLLNTPTDVFETELKSAYYPAFTSKTEAKPSFALKTLLLFSLAVSIALAGANVWASHSLSVVVADLLPVPDVMQLSRADQYNGLGDRSRQRCKDFTAISLFISPVLCP